MSVTITSLKIKIREFLNPYLAPTRRFFLRKKGADLNFTIISNNCWAGHVYRYYGLPYNTPTIGLFFFAADYIKFVYNLRFYINHEITFIRREESLYSKYLEDSNINCPIGKIEDIEVIFLHYSTEEEARDKWERRKNRICWDNIVFKMSEQNQCERSHIEQFDRLPGKRKFVFVSKDYSIESQVIYYGYENVGEVKNDTARFRRYIDLNSYISGLPFKLRQS